MRLIGITGSIACGKTTVSRELLRRGFPVIDGDSLSRELTGPDGQAMNEIRAVFGDRFLMRDGSLDRREMGALVFSDPAARNRLDRLMAPYLRKLTLSRIEEARSSGASLCFLDFPLLYEKGYDQYCDSVWCVWLPEDLQLKRLMERDGFSRDDALSRMRAVMSSDEKANLASFVVDNSGTVENTLAQVSAQLALELRRAESAPRRRRAAPPVAETAVPAVYAAPPSSAAPVAYAASRPSDASGSSPASVPPSSTSAAPAAYDTAPSAASGAADSLIHRRRPADPASAALDDPGFARPEASRKKPSARKTSWLMPRPLSASLICLAAILVLCFTAQMLMRAYLARRQEEHIAEQNAIDARYPLEYADSIRSIAGEYYLAPSLVAAVIMNESSFRPGVKSSVGACGLMQVMPDTAEWIAHKLQIDDFHIEQLDDPETNIRFGCWYLNYLSSLFSGDPLCVVCAYHAGQGEISSWLSNPLYSSDGITLNQESLPDGPTKEYAGRVIRDYGIYQAKYFGPDSGGGSSADAAAAR